MYKIIHLCVNHSHKNVKCLSQYFANTRIVPSFTMTEGYCVKCRTKREMKGTSAVTLKNGKPATKGTCPTCNTSMFRIGKVL